MLRNSSVSSSRKEVNSKQEEEREEESEGELSIYNLESNVEIQKRYCGNRLSKRALILLSCSLVILLLVLIGSILAFVLGKYLIQKYTKESSISLISLDFPSFPKNTFYKELNITSVFQLQQTSPLNALIEFTRVDLHYKDKYLLTIELPNMEINSEEKNIEYKLITTLDLTNINIFSEVSQDIMTLSNIELQIQGEFIVTVLGISFSNLSFYKALLIRGMSGFINSPPKVHSIVLNECSKDHLTLRINSTLLNPSQLAFGGLGKLNLSILLKNTLLGNAISHSNNLPLHRGDNLLLFNATLLLNNNTKNAIQNLMISFLSSPTSLHLSGKSNNVSNIVILNSLLKYIEMDMQVKSQDANIQINCFPAI